MTTFFQHGRAAAVLLAFGLAVPDVSVAEKIRIHGSDTLLILNSEWASEYHRANRDTTIVIIGGGSELGFEALLKGETDIAAASRPIRKEEIEKIKAASGAAPLEVPVALDGIAIYVHDTNPVHFLKLDQLRKIFTGEIRNWKEVGGPNRPIQVVSRNSDSGTTTFFREYALGGAEIMEEAMFMGTTSAVVTTVARQRDAIGFGGVAYASGSRIVRLISAEGGKPVWPTPMDVARGTYPLSRTLYYYVHPKDRQVPGISRFLKWVHSERAQLTAERLNYYPLPTQLRSVPDWNGQTARSATPPAVAATQPVTPAPGSLGRP